MQFYAHRETGALEFLKSGSTCPKHFIFIGTIRTFKDLQVLERRFRYRGSHTISRIGRWSVKVLGHLKGVDFHALGIR